MSFLEIQFPNWDSVPMPARGGPMFNTSVITAASGYEQRNQWWQIPRRKWDVAARLDEDQKDVMLAFFMNAGGKANGFRKRDWSDYQLVGGEIGTGDGSTKTFQLKKTYTIGAQSVTVDIKKPVTSSVVDYENTAQSNTVKIYFDDVLQSSGWTVNYTTGLVTFTSAPAGGVVITADCDFDIPVRFDTDSIEFTLVENRLDGVGGIYECASLPLVEVRV